jgi:dihydropteroate synthase
VTATAHATISTQEKLRRVLPVVRELAAAGAIVSVDTMRAEVAARALEPARGWSTTSQGASPTPRCCR